MFSKIKKMVYVILLMTLAFSLIGCDESFQTYVKKDYPLHKIKKIIVFPFKNIAREKNADDYLHNAIYMELMRSGLIEVINLNEAEKALKEARIRTAGGVEDLAVSQAKKLGESLGIQAVILGVIEDFGPGGKTGSPQFSGFLYMVDTNDGSIVWSCSYTGSGDSKNYIFDINKIETPTLFARTVMAKMLAPLIKKTQNSEAEAEKKINEVEKEVKEIVTLAEKKEAEAKILEGKAIELESMADATEKSAAETEDIALKMDPEAIANEIKSLEGELATKTDKLTQSEEELKKVENLLSELSSKVKEKEDASKQATAEAEEIAGQVNIYTAKQRVAVIRNNTEEAEKFKALAEEAKVKGDESSRKAEDLKKEVTEAKAKVEEMTPRINGVRKKVNDLKAENDKVTAKLAEIKQMQALAPIEPTEENLKKAADAKAEAKKTRQNATLARENAKKARKDADVAKESAKKTRMEATEIEKKAADLKAKLRS